jgi:hypothetical protein
MDDPVSRKPALTLKLVVELKADICAGGDHQIKGVTLQRLINYSIFCRYLSGYLSNCLLLMMVPISLVSINCMSRFAMLMAELTSSKL